MQRHNENGNVKIMKIQDSSLRMTPQQLHSFPDAESIKNRWLTTYNAQIHFCTPEQNSEFKKTLIMKIFVCRNLALRYLMHFAANMYNDAILSI